MDFIAHPTFAFSDFAVYALALVGMALVLVAALLVPQILEKLGVNVGRGRLRSAVTVVQVAASSLVMGLMFATPVAYLENQDRDRRDEVLAAFNSTYGLELTTDELQDLRYPYGPTVPDPAAGFDIYGSIDRELGDSDELSKIALIYSEGQIQLAEVEGSDFTPLETVS